MDCKVVTYNALDFRSPRGAVDKVPFLPEKTGTVSGAAVLLFTLLLYC